MPRWKRGQSGNPKGRPKHEQTFTAALRAKGTPDELATLAWKAAREGAPWAIQMIFNRLEPISAQVHITEEKTNATIEYTRLTAEELEQLERLLERARGRTEKTAGGESPPQLL